jgi:hypothetical protein
MIEIQRAPGGLGLYIGIQPLAKALCAKITQFEETLQHDEAARKSFKHACEHQRIAELTQDEAGAWRRLAAVR